MSVYELTYLPENKLAVSPVGLGWLLRNSALTEEAVVYAPSCLHAVGDFHVHHVDIQSLHAEDTFPKNWVCGSKFSCWQV